MRCLLLNKLLFDLYFVSIKLVLIWNKYKNWINRLINYNFWLCFQVDRWQYIYKYYCELHFLFSLIIIIIYDLCLYIIVFKKLVTDKIKIKNWNNKFISYISWLHFQVDRWQYISLLFKLLILILLNHLWYSVKSTACSDKHVEFINVW